MDEQASQRIHQELQALRAAEQNAYTRARPEVQRMVRRLIHRIEELDPTWTKAFRPPLRGVSIQLGDDSRKWVWFDGIPYGNGNAPLVVCFVGKHRHGDDHTDEPGYPTFPPTMYDPNMPDGRRFRLRLASDDDLNFLFQHQVLETSLAKLGNG
jgi:hypothetical protein